MSRQIKCVVWDLDNTIWDGVLLEGDQLELRPHILDILRELDGRGILHSIASRNDAQPAIDRLKAFGLAEYFLVPQIGWSRKSDSVRTIADLLNIGIDAIAFVDDQAFERAEVQFTHPDVLVLDGADPRALLEMPEMRPQFLTEDSARRRHMYISDFKRKETEEAFTGPRIEFLETLNMNLTIAPATVGDLQRAEELTVRTHQLNTTGVEYSYDELAAFITSNSHLLLVSELVDDLGPYGKIGVALLETSEEEWTLKLFLMSCRVMSVGIGTVMLNHIQRLARKAGADLLVDFRPTDRNRAMFATLKFAGFEDVGRKGDLVILKDSIPQVPPVPAYVRLSEKRDTNQ